MSKFDHDTIENKNTRRYVEGQKKPLEADFLLLEKAKQTTILEDFNVSNIQELLNNINIPTLWALELAILYHLKTTELIRRVWIIREKFQSKCSEQTYRHYQDSLPTCLQESNLKQEALDPQQIELLRDDTISIARQLQRLAYIRICRSESINERKCFVIQSTLLIMVVGFMMFRLLNANIDWLIQTEIGKDGAKFLLLVISSGVTGSAISMLQRIEKASNMQPEITDSIHDTMQITLNMSNWYITSLLVSGAIFALLIHFIAVAQLVNVLDILPNMSKSQMPENITLLQQLTLAPDNRIDMAKLLLACFLSGFGERLVPDILDSLIKKTEHLSRQNLANTNK